MMSLTDLLPSITKHVPRHILRLIVGGAALGLVLMLFLKVVDEAFGLPVSTLNWIAIGVSAIFALFLCSEGKALSERCLHFAAGAIVIFAVGLTSNNVIADMRNNLGLEAPPAPIPTLEQILATSAVDGG